MPLASEDANDYYSKQLTQQGAYEGMSKQQTISINGVTYDAHTGMRLDDAEPIQTHSSKPSPQRTQSVAAHELHSAKTKHSQTLSRRHVAIPAHKAPSIRTKQAVVHHAKSPLVSKFAAPEHPKPVHKPVAIDIGPVYHPKANAAARSTKPVIHQAPKPAQHGTPSNQEVKDHAIRQAMERATTNKSQHQLPKRRAKVLSIAAGGFAIMLLAGYLTYINMPSLSVKVASAQAGIAASYPSYQPSGYGLAGPVAFNDGQVTMKFIANSGPQAFTLNQSRSTWDSSALLDNYVDQVSNGDYQTYQDSGLTIYTYGTDAAWVNGGILHTINSDAHLSADQIRRIATSM